MLDIFEEKALKIFRTLDKDDWLLFMEKVHSTQDTQSLEIAAYYFDNESTNDVDKKELNVIASSEIAKRLKTISKFI